VATTAANPYGKTRHRTVLGRSSVLGGSLALVMVLGLVAAASAAVATPTAGDRDPGFGDFGKRVTDFGDVDSALASFTQADGKIVVAGVSGNSVAVVRYEADGSVDTGFAGGGKTIAAFDGVVSAVAFQADGKIVAAGRTVGADFAVARYNPDGSLDSTFDGDGQVSTDFGAFDEARAVAIQADGKIVAAGVTGSVDFAVARYNPDGSLDSTFDGDGQVTTDFGGNQDGAYAVAIQTDGRIVAAGSSSPDVYTEYFALARYNPDGSLDSTFDGDGLAITDAGFARVRELALQSDGKIVAAGDGSPNSVLARYNPDGSLDSSFDGDGLVAVDSSVVTITLQADGKIVAGGSTGSDFALARYNPDGTLDESFGISGMVTTDFDATLDGISEVTIQPDGKILAVGGAANLSGFFDSDFAIARYVQGEGCLPRFWRQKKNDALWADTGLSQNDDYDSTFGVDLFDPDITLGESLTGRGLGSLRGNTDLKRLVQHGTAALLNAAHPEISYTYSAAQVISLVQAEDLERLSASNEADCPLG